MLDRVTARERLTAEVHFRNEVARFCDLNRLECQRRIETRAIRAD